MEQRSHLRIPLNLEAQVSARGIEATPCMIKDFCSGGMLIELVQGVEQINMHFGPGDELSVCVKVPTKSSFHSLQLKSLIARATNSSLGVSFVNPDQAALQALENYSRHLENSKTIIPQQSFNENTQRIHALCKRCAGDNITALMQSFFPQVDNALMNSADAAKNNMVQGAFLAAARELKTKRREIITGFSKSVNSKFDENLGNFKVNSSISESEPLSSGNLEIIDKEDFEGWLVSKMIIVRAEEKYSRQLLELKIRYSTLLGDEINSQGIPVSPSIFCNAFSECFSRLNVETITGKIIFNVFESAFINELGVIYEEINNILINSGILPDLSAEEISRYVAVEANKNSPAREKNLSKNKNSLSGPDVKLSSLEDSSGVTKGSSSSFANHVESSQINSGIQQTTQEEEFIQVGTPAINDASFSASFPEHLQRQKNTSRERFNLQQKIAKDAYKTVKNLLKISEQHHNLSKVEEVGEKIAPESPNNPKMLNQEEVLAVLDSAQKTFQLEKNSEPELRAAQLFNNNDEFKLSKKDLQKLGNIDKLFEAMHSVINNKEVSDSLQRLQIPLSKLIFMDESFYENQIHPARLLINKVAEFDEAGGVQNAKTIKEIDRVIASVVSDYGRDASVFDSALEDVNKLVEIKKRI